MNKLWSITANTLKILLRTRQTIFFTFLVPLLLMLVIGYVTQPSSASLEIGVVHDNGNEAAAQFVENLQQSESLDISTGSLTEEKNALTENQRDLVMELPADFSLNPERAEPYNIILYENITNPIQSNIAQSVTREIFTATERGIKQQAPLFRFETMSVQSDAIRYIDFLVYGIIGMTIMQLGIFATAFAIVEAKTKGVLKRIIATPITAWQYVGGNMLARLIISLGQSAILILIAILLFDVRFHNWPWLVVLIVIGNIVFLSLGLFISGVAKSVESVPILGNLIVFPMLLLGGVFFPTSSLPDWLKIVVDQLPIALMTSMMRDTVAGGKTLTDVWVPLLVFIGWALFALLLANSFFRLREKE